jgi:hypothetical protein
MLLVYVLGFLYLSHVSALSATNNSFWVRVRVRVRVSVRVSVRVRVRVVVMVMVRVRD